MPIGKTRVSNNRPLPGTVQEAEIAQNGQPASGIRNERKCLIGLWEGTFEVPEDFESALIDDETRKFLIGEIDTVFVSDEGTS